MPRDVSYLAIISLLSHKIFKKQYYFRFNLGTVLLLAFTVWVFMSGFFSQHADEALFQFSEIFEYVLCLISNVLCLSSCV